MAGMFNEKITFFYHRWRRFLTVDFADYYGFKAVERRNDKELIINHGFTLISRIFYHEAHEGHEEIFNRGLRWFTRIRSTSSGQALSQVIAFVHKAIEMAFFRSWLKRGFFRQEKAENAQKTTKNDQKSAL
jgi:hypothetical protein